MPTPVNAHSDRPEVHHLNAIVDACSIRLKVAARHLRLRNTDQAISTFLQVQRDYRSADNAAKALHVGTRTSIQSRLDALKSDMDDFDSSLTHM